MLACWLLTAAGHDEVDDEQFRDTTDLLKPENVCLYEVSMRAVRCGAVQCGAVCVCVCVHVCARARVCTRGCVVCS
jgi:hypothetical protein